ncbi:hypothetical protein K491DRAFT_716923 [Lophiostoma macrostomum CBS 122681]|uniref:Uncharacterized protein n=1 Tax=Lophiostoma macrostomum CBS 122681 TaxID=1314788 RepID=A0A6A6T6W4_9PLEO|nr:hypothetical protein K491DRAFT_716923 [Lophiostoma macrostomum CBS 122681]
MSDRKESLQYLTEAEDHEDVGEFLVMIPDTVPACYIKPNAPGASRWQGEEGQRLVAYYDNPLAKDNVIDPATVHYRPIPTSALRGFTQHRIEIIATRFPEASKCSHLLKDGRCMDADNRCYISHLESTHPGVAGADARKKWAEEYGRELEDIFVWPQYWTGARKGVGIKCNDLAELAICIEGWKELERNS